MTSLEASQKPRVLVRRGLPQAPGQQVDVEVNPNPGERATVAEVGPAVRGHASGGAGSRGVISGTASPAGR